MRGPETTVISIGIKLAHYRNEAFICNRASVRQSSRKVIMKVDSYNSWNSLGLELQTSRKTVHEQPQVLKDAFRIVYRSVWMGNCYVRTVNVRHRTCITLEHSFKAQQSTKSQK
jgi:hypothetical protein